MPDSDNLRGETLGDRYRISRRISAGQTGTTYRGLDHSQRRQVAIKALHPTLCQVPEQVKRFQREFEATRNLDHPNVVQTHELLTHRGRWFIVMELLEGRMLAERLQQRTPPDLVEALEITRDVARGLSAAHGRKVIHRDLNPGNIMLLRDGRTKVLGFGVSRLSEAVSDEITAVGVRLGNTQYMAPEYIQSQEIDSRADLYALGCLLHLLLTGDTPFIGPSLKVMDSHVSQPASPPSVKAAGIPPFVDELTLELLSKRPEDRPDGAEAVAQRIDAMILEVRSSDHWGPISSGANRDAHKTAPNASLGFGSGAYKRPQSTDIGYADDETDPGQEAESMPDTPSPSRIPILVGLAAVALMVTFASLVSFWVSH